MGRELATKQECGKCQGWLLYNFCEWPVLVPHHTNVAAWMTQENKITVFKSHFGLALLYLQC